MPRRAKRKRTCSKIRYASHENEHVPFFRFRNRPKTKHKQILSRNSSLKIVDVFCFVYHNLKVYVTILVAIGNLDAPLSNAALALELETPVISNKIFPDFIGAIQ